MKVIKRKYGFERGGKRCMAAVLLGACLTAVPVSAEPGYEEVASKVSFREIGDYGMIPIYGRDIEDGSYSLKVESSSSFFKILNAELTVQDGEMEAVLEMYSSSYPYLFVGKGEEAAQAPLETYIPLEDDGRMYSFTIPVEALNTPLDVSAFSKKKKKWYDRKLLFRAEDLPQEALAFRLPDYKRIGEAIALYDEANGTDTLHAQEEAAEPQVIESLYEGPVDMEEADGEYSIEVAMAGGSGRASVTSPTWLYIRDGKAYARLLWSSSYYDYMIVNGEKYLNETKDGSNSTFTIPILALDEGIEVTADTTAMGDPVEIEYTLTFYADTVGNKEKVPQEATIRVVELALGLMAVGGVLNHVVKKRKRK